MKPEPFRNQKYRILKKQLIKEGKLFTDIEFPPADSSIFVTNSSLGENVEWKRPGEIVKDPRLFVEGVSANDVTQGIIGNCWFVAACSALTHNKTLLNKVIPDACEQEWDSSNPDRYCGIFHFCFWRFGNWYDVVVDDMLPTKDNELIFARSKTTNEFWSALLEKAFAKLNGSYESLIGGTLTEAIVDISGGVPENITLNSSIYTNNMNARAELFNSLKEAFELKALIAACIKSSPEEENEQLECGLVKGHSYAISAIKKLALDANYSGLIAHLFSKPEKVMMVRMQNPWGEKEWNGPWSDESDEWKLISAHQQQELGLKIEEDGQFWMTWEDFCSHFTDVSVCHQINTKFFTLHKRYNEKIYQGLWMDGVSRGDLTDRAGGCANYPDSCLCNPQYMFDVAENDCEVVVALMQRDVRERKRFGAAYKIIGMMIWRVEANRTFRLHQFTPPILNSDYINNRSVFLKTKFKSGRYVVIPSTLAPGEEGEFMLRIFSTSNLNVRELTVDQPYRGCFGWMRKNYACVTRLKISGAKDLTEKVDSYCIVKCEGNQYHSPTCRSTSSPKWEVEIIFLRRYPNKPILIDIWSASLLKDTFIGRASIDCPITNDTKCVEVPLKDSTKATAQYLSSKLVVEFATYDKPDML